MHNYETVHVYGTGTPTYTGEARRYKKGDSFSVLPSTDQRTAVSDEVTDIGGDVKWSRNTHAQFKAHFLRKC